MANAYPSAAQIESFIIEHLSRLLRPGTKLDSETHFLDTGIDSIEAVDLTVALEDWIDRDVDPNATFAHPTVGALARALAVTDDVAPTEVEAPASFDAGAPPCESPSRPERSAGADAPKPMRSDSHGFASSVNPALAGLLEKLGLDRRFVRGQGSSLFDERGQRILDFVAAYGALPFGHNPPEIWQAVHAMEERGEPCFAQPSLLDPAGELAERILRLAPEAMESVTFANSGAEAVEAAIKMCRMRTGRLGIVSTRGGFHGKTLASLSATGNPRYQERTGAPAAGFEHIPFGDAPALRELFTRRPADFAAFIVEPIQGEGGIVMPPPGYLEEVRAICDEANVLLIFDEVQTGLGRTGAWFACNHARVSPDVMTLAKALGGGLMPIGAVLASKAAWSDDFGLEHSSTFAGGGLACRVALATLDLLERDDAAIIERVAELGRRLKDRLEAIAARYAHLISEVRGRGFLLGLRFSAGRQTWPSSILGIAGDAGGLTPLFASYLLNVEQVRLAPTLNGVDVIRIEPPLTATWQECEEVLAAIERTLEVFATGDSARVLGSIRQRRALPATNAPVSSSTRLRSTPRPEPGDARFAFLLHPLTLESYADFDSTLAAMPTDEVPELARTIHGLAEATVVGETRIVSSAGASAYGEFILIGNTAEELRAMPHHEAADRVRSGVELARDRGAEIVGLGAFTSIVTQGGLALRDSGVALTSGGSFTASAAHDGLMNALEGGDPRRTVAILGAAGAIGRAMVARLLGDCERLVLVGNPERSHEYLESQLVSVLAEACEHLSRTTAGASGGSLAARILSAEDRPTTNATPAGYRRFVEAFRKRDGTISLSNDAAAAARQADVVVTATSATEALLAPEDLKPGAIVCEISRPYNLGKAIRQARPDIHLIEAGVIEIPGQPNIGSFGLPEGHAYACMAETMILALEKRYENASLGPRLELPFVHELGSLSRKHGFKVAADAPTRTIERAPLRRTRTA